MVVCPAEEWQESGRWDGYGKELFRMRDDGSRRAAEQAAGQAGNQVEHWVHTGLPL